MKCLILTPVLFILQTSKAKSILDDFLNFCSVLKEAHLTGEDVDALASFINPKYEEWDINHVTQCLTYSPPGKLPVGLNNDVSRSRQLAWYENESKIYRANLQDDAQGHRKGRETISNS